MKLTLLTCLILAATALAPAQEGTGFDAHVTLTGQFSGSTLLTESPRYGAPVNATGRVFLYPIYKWNDHWSATGAYQLYTYPFFSDTFNYSGNGVRGALMQGTLNYSRVSEKGSLLVRAGQIPSAFGSFLLRYDDADDVVAGLPLQYGYYYEPIQVHGLLAAQVDATRGKWDGRLQLASSSASNPRGITQNDQYANWSGGAGFTPRLGLRIGASASHGPYLSRSSDDFPAGEISPRNLPASAYGVEGSWTHAHFILLGEWQHFTFPYTVRPVYREHAGYVEGKLTVAPRWYLANRSGYKKDNADVTTLAFEEALGYRPSASQLIKLDFRLQPTIASSTTLDKTVTLQYVLQLHSLSGLDLERHGRYAR